MGSKREYKTCNLKATDYYFSEDMHFDLEALAKTGELPFEEILSVKTIKGWIGRYSANFKKEASEQALTKANSNASRTTSSKCQKTRLE
ncbi:15702_t:CDS:2 [Gigaspora margarita]|uniref:15702_t:CDS:1 n=1 Tax=Gigaspora margarita TaxID=4874 RepID=A0ABN7VKM2_GIGMA|nr:15702_t:CDS:2 [Gigaspora margarita]